MAPRAGPPTAGLNLGFKLEAVAQVGVGIMAAKFAPVGWTPDTGTRIWRKSPAKVGYVVRH